MKVRNVQIEKVAYALSNRIVDNYDDGLDDTKLILNQSLYSMLVVNPTECENLWNSGIIEEDYFDDLT